MSEQPSIFVSYSHADSKWLRELDPHLKGLELSAQLERFDDRQLLGGDDWDVEVKAALDRADIVVLLVTANFIGSEYIHRVELPTALKRRADQGCVIIPVLFETCYRKLLEIEDVNYLPKDLNGKLKPLAEWRGPQRAAGLTQIIEHIHAQIDRRRANAEREAEVTATSGIDLATYRRRARVKWSAIDLSALAAPGAVDADVTIRLADVFVPQLARRSRPVVSLPRDYLEKQGLDPAAEAERAAQIAGTWERLVPVSALELAAECGQRHLVLLGDPGAGKSALARYVLLQLLDDTPTAGSPLAALTGYVPFLIELRDYVAREAEGRCTDLLSYLAYGGRELGFGFDEGALNHRLGQQPSLLIIDGLDEIFDPQRRRLMVDQIIGLVWRFPKLRLLITSRVAGFDDHPFRMPEFAIATLIDLTAEQIEGFAKAWFAIVFSGDPDAANRARGDLLDAVQRSPQLHAIAGNPMILTIMATVARHRRLGRSRTALYTQALELLCYNWDYKRGLGLPPDSPLIDLQADDTLLMLRRIAWRMQEVPDGLRANAIGETALREVILNFFEHDWRFDHPKAGRAAGEMLRRLEERNWVLTLRGPALYGFVHRTFLEYLCALELTERFKAQQLDVDQVISLYVLPRLDDDTWHEIVRLLIGTLPPLAAERILLSILPTEVAGSTDASRLAFGWQGIAEMEPRHIPTLRQACGRLTDLLYSWFAGGASSYALRGAIIDALTVMGRIAWPAPHPPSRSWPVFAGGSGWYESYRYFDLIGLLGKTVWNCSAEACQLIRACVVGDVGEDTRAGALSALAERFSEDPETKLLLQARALDDPGAEARSAALRGLAEQFSEDPETELLLRARALDDPGAEARSSALYGLGYCKDPATKFLLRARAHEDPDAGPRCAALNALAESFTDDPETKILLRARTVEDPDADARGEALEALARSSGDDPETKILLRARLFEDPDVGGRRAALGLMVEMFGSESETEALLRECAVRDPGALGPESLVALAQQFADDQTIKALLSGRARVDPNKDCRAAAFYALSREVCGRQASIIASKDLDGLLPGRDPREQISPEIIAKCAARLQQTPASVRALFERLAEQLEVPLTFG
jgi:hypothetical protein